MKRLIDVFSAAVLLFLLAPVMAGVAVAVLLSMGRPIVFLQSRPGREPEAVRHAQVPDDVGCA